MPRCLQGFLTFSPAVKELREPKRVVERCAVRKLAAWLGGFLRKRRPVKGRKHIPLGIQRSLHSLKLTFRHGKSTILMVFTRKHGDFHGRTVSFREGISIGIYFINNSRVDEFLKWSFFDFRKLAAFFQVSWKKFHAIPTVDGRNPKQPPGMCKTRRK